MLKATGGLLAAGSVLGTVSAESRVVVSPGDSIQEAIATAAPGATIVVESGTYSQQQVVVDKPLTLVGEPGDEGNRGPGDEAPVLDGENSLRGAITIPTGVTGVTIAGIEITNYQSQDSHLGYGVRAGQTSSDVAVRNMAFENIARAPVLVESTGAGRHENWTVASNIFEDFGTSGISLGGCSNSKIVDNEIRGSRGQSGRGIRPERNIPRTSIFLSSNRRFDVQQEVLMESVTVEGNTIEGPTVRGISAVAIDKTTSEKPVQFRDLEVTDNQITGMGAGVSLKASRGAHLANADVTQNTISQMSRAGVSLGTLDAELGPASHGEISVANNTIKGVDRWGVVLIPMSSGAVAVHHNEIRNNRYGIAKNQDHNPDKHRVYANDITGNDIGAGNGGGIPLNARDNWWGHPTGPSGDDGRTNPAGKVIGRGDEVRGDVLFKPWRRREVVTEN
jgi:hypothetical protein